MLALSAPVGAAPLFSLTPTPPPMPPADVGAAPQVVHVAQSRAEAELAVRIQQLEEQIRVLTGQVEGLQFQMTQMQTMLEKQNADNDYRFQQLEGGAPAGKAPPAAPATSGEAPPIQTQTTETQATASVGEPAVAGDVPELSASDVPMDQLEVPMDSIGESHDPLVGSSGGASVLVAPAGQGELANLGGGRPLDLSLDGGTPTNGDAKAQYAAGYDAIVRGDYAFAEEQFKQFIALYPNDPQVPDATNWLGEALIQRGEYSDAADVLLKGYQKYPDAERAPDMLLKVGIALSGDGETEPACRIFAEVVKRYPQQTPAFAGRLSTEREKAKCPA
jgi:tol-pal system protein YbgF